ncbi:MAG: hypothetical protein Q6K80_01480 [Thermostichus sp. DG_1_6_bins_120]
MSRRASLTDQAIIIDHPLVQHKLSLMGRVETTTAEVQALMGEDQLAHGRQSHP